jgi:hypothetical protein
VGTWAAPSLRFVISLKLIVKFGGNLEKIFEIDQWAISLLKSWICPRRWYNVPFLSWNVIYFI